MYRLQVYDREHHRHALAHPQGRGRALPGGRRSGAAGRPVAATRRGCRRRRGRMEVAVAIGTDPAVTYAATAPLPGAIDEMTFAGFLRRRSGGHGAVQDRGPRGPGARRVRARGLRRPGRARREGPFGDHTGYYSLADDYPVLHLTALTHRRDAIYSTTIVGRPPMEDAYLGKATERLFLPLLQAHPARNRGHGPAQGGRLPQLRHRLDRQALPAARPQGDARALGTGQMLFAKCVVVVDARRGRARLRPGGLARLQQRRLAAGRHDRRGAAGRARPLLAAPAAGRQDRHRRHHASGPRKGTTGSGPPTWRCRAEVKARVDELWPSSRASGGPAPARPAPRG